MYLQGGNEIDEREFVCTDLAFGSGDEKHPLLICGGVAANSLSVARLRGIDLVAIEGSENSPSSGT